MGVTTLMRLTATKLVAPPAESSVTTTSVSRTPGCVTETTTVASTGMRGTAPVPAMLDNSTWATVPNALTPDGNATEMMTAPIPLMSFLAPVTPPLSGNVVTDVVSTSAGDATETTTVVIPLMRSTAPPSTPACAVT